MKKLFFVIPLIVVFAFFGCTKDNPAGGGGGGTSIPTDVSIQATPGGLGIDVIWSAVIGADSYEVDLPGSNNAIVIDTTSGTKTYSHNSPTEMGTYRVKAFSNNTASNWSASCTSNPVQGSGTIYEWDAAGHSCYYWDIDGNGYTISRTDPNAVSLCDIYLYDNTTSDLYIFCSNEQPLGGSKTTFIYYDASTTSTYAHTTPWYNGWIAGVNNMNGYYWIELSSGRYVRIKLTTVAGTSISFSFLYQKIQGFRYVE